MAVSYNPSGVQGVGANLQTPCLLSKRVVFGEDSSNSIEPVMTYRQRPGFLNATGQRRATKIRQSSITIQSTETTTTRLTFSARVLNFYGEVEKYQNVRGGFFQPGSYTVSAHVPLGAACGQLRRTRCRVSSLLTVGETFSNGWPR